LRNLKRHWQRSRQARSRVDWLFAKLVFALPAESKREGTCHVRSGRILATCFFLHVSSQLSRAHTRITGANLRNANTAAGWPQFAPIPRAPARTGIRNKGCEARRLGEGEPVKYWEIIADRLHAQGWSYGIAEHLTNHGLLFCVDAHRDGKRFIVKADDLLTAFSFAGERRDGAKRS
jgi:hypothetical protein